MGGQAPTAGSTAKDSIPRVGFVSLGCPKNTVDSERIVTQLRAEGYELSNSYENSDVVVVNTCGFIDAAVQESLDTIGEALTENGKVIVTGCLGVKEDTIREVHPNVLAVTGPHAYDEVMNQIHEHLPPQHDPFMDLVPPAGLKLTPQHYAYLKISEGCNHKCTFCIIPSMRGKLVSRDIGSVLQEAQNLVESGVQELLVVSQDTSAYGIDTKYRTGFWNGMPVKTRFKELCAELGKLDAWTRLHYVYPYPHVDDIIPYMAEGKILPYLDIPFQHASQSVLKNMKRPAASEKVLGRIKQWRDLCPDMTVRSTFIVGFPGETEDDFKELIDFLYEADLDRAGCFKYSPVEGAKANDLADHVDPDIAQERWETFMAVQQEISANRLAKKVGKELDILIDEITEEGAIGRTKYDAPEIDGVVHIKTEEELEVGDMVTATITGSDEYDLFVE
ncbi:30S ribosomal protein S12 methylthiotransferase RimO [Pleionea sp. CnH1-48]|uniref:30S ribosomal protein S12 methylthiotransferase RimO n=1 Tax=Pleionea sp. CnH1-48 TaxID=2954494 RepID=UPI002096A5EF|nr:30S ribosomal protein S12 methylthiotransferase RimO [Pleionea sp. CnH1-48]MCO7227090.1 30S ribosomal protein S12 methylthiotransferase RimO [Pleionea sp. CnH1-48]